MEDLKNTVIQTLEQNGILGKLRAELRKSVFEVIEKQDQATKQNVGFQWENPLAAKLLETMEGQLCTDLIREFLEFYRMDYTLSTFLPECSLSQDPKTRDQICDKIGLPQVDPSLPVLMHLLLSFMKGLTTSHKEPEPPKIEQKPVEEKPAPPITQVKKEPEPVKEQPKTQAAPVFEAPAPKKKTLEPLVSKSPEPIEDKSKSLKMDPISVDKEKMDLLDAEQSLSKIEKSNLQVSYEKKNSKETSEDYADDFDDDIVEDLPQEEIEDNFEQDKQAQSASQSIGMDPSVTSLDIEGYDHIEEVELMQIA